MKTIMAAVFYLAAASLGRGQSWTGTLPATSISLEARQMAAKREVSNSYVTSWGSYDKTFNRERVVEITVRTLARVPSKVVVKTSFLGRRPTGQQKILVVQRQKPLDLAPGGRDVWEETSGEVQARDLNLELADYRRTGGASIIGWVVTCESPDGKLIAVRASEEPLAQLARTGELAKLPRR